MRRFHRFIRGQDIDGQSVEEAFASAESSGRFTADLEPASYAEDKFALYKAYQITVHKDKPEDVKPSGFKRFLCDTPLLARDGYGSFHQSYRVDGKLMALAVLDLLPGCISSVYFIYDPEYSHLSLGRVSACREAMLSKETPFGEYYMGYYIPNCTKMKYKGEYAPSFLKDPAGNVWLPLERYQSHFKMGKLLVSFEMDLASNKGTCNDVWDAQMPGILSRDACHAVLTSLPNTWVFDQDEQGVAPLALTGILMDKARLNRFLEMLATTGQDIFTRESFIIAV